MLMSTRTRRRLGTRHKGLRLFGDDGIAYILQDLFTTDRAAGAVNGTAAEPVGGLRVVTDTNGKLSIVGGVASFATGGVGSGNPGLWYETTPRVLGKAVLLNATITMAQFQAGWDSNQSGTFNDAFSFQSAGSLRLTNNSTELIVGAYSTATAYQLAVVLRTTGAYYFIKGGAFTNWTLIWAGAAGNQANMFAGAAARDTNCVAVADNIRVPVSLYIPTPLAYDTFTRADAALGNSETVGPDAQAVTARAWTGATYTISTNKAINTPTLGADVIVNGGFGTDTDWNKGAGWGIAAGLAGAITASSDLTASVAPLVVGTWYSVTYTLSGFGAGTVNAKLGSTAFPTHASNATYTETGLALTTAFAFTGVGFTGSIDDVSCKPLTLSELIATMAPGTADYLLNVNATMVSASDGKQLGIISNLDSAVTPANFRLCVLDGRGNAVCYDCIAGAYTVKMTTAITYAAAAPLRSILSGTELRSFYNNAAVGSLATMAANASQLCGLFSTSPLSSLDVWQAMARGTGGEYAGLDAY